MTRAAQAADPPRILLVLPTYLPETFGGAEQQTARYARALARAGCAVTLLAPRLKPDTAARESDRGVRVRRFHLSAPPNLGGRHMDALVHWSVQVIGWMLRHRKEFDVVHVIHARLHAIPAVIGGRLLGKPVVNKVGRGGAVFDLTVVRGKKLLGPAFFQLLRWGTDAFVANSSQIQADLLAAGVAPGRIHRIPNGVEIPEPPDRAARAGPVRFVSVGRLDHGKALDVLARAFAALPADMGARLDIVGDGPSRLEVQALVRQLDPAGRIAFAGATDDVPAWLSAADVYVSTSRSEGMSNALLEAMSFALPALVTCVSGVGDIVQDGISGWLAPVDDVGAFTARLAEAAAMDPDRRLTMGAAAAETIARRFGIDAVAASHLELYGRLLNRSKTSAALASAASGAR